MKIQADWLNNPALIRVMSLLSDAGHQIYLVGGCVRNALLHEPTSDFDLSTNAHPETVMELAKSAGIKALPTGIEHGTITLIVDKTPFEITTFRKDVETDGRRAVVAFSDQIEDDARRRDLTINALYADATGTIVDPLGGLPDLLARRIRFIEDPEQRIKEDYLRILRFFRFHAWYGDPSKGLDAEALAACAEQADGIDGLSKERVGAEMRKLLSALDPAPAIAAMAQSGILVRVLTGAENSALAPLIALEAHYEVAPNWITRLAALTRAEVRDALRLSKSEDQLRKNTIACMDQALPTKVAAYRYGYDIATSATLIMAASLGQHPDPSFKDEATTGAAAVFPIKAVNLPDHLQGKAIGDELRALEARWIASDFTATKSDLLS